LSGPSKTNLRPKTRTVRFEPLPDLTSLNIQNMLTEKWTRNPKYGEPYPTRKFL